MPRRRRRRRGGTHKRLLVVTSIVLIFVGSAAGAVSTGAFTTLNSNSGANVGAAGGADAFLGLDIADSVSVNTNDRLVTVTNNLGSPMTITVSLQSSNAGTLFAPGQQGSTVSFNLGVSSSETVDIEASPGAAVSFTITADAGGTTVEGTRTVPVRGVGPIEIEIDIKPDDEQNTVNPRSKGVISVAILHTEDFDPTTDVDVNSLRFGATDDVTLDNNEGARPAHGGHIEDVDGDGDDDLLLHFPIEDTGFDSEDEEGRLVGLTTDENDISGTDSVEMVG